MTDQLTRLAEEDGKLPDNAARLMYHNGNYVMAQAVKHFGRKDRKAAVKVIRKVIRDPVYLDAMERLDYHDFTLGEKLRNVLAASGFAGIYGRWLGRKYGI